MTLFERTSEKNGKTYFTGWLGDTRVVVVKDDRVEEPRFGSKAEWRMYVNERDEQNRGV
jgi:hypothetical protein